MLKLTVHLQGWHSSFSQAFHQEYNLHVIYFHPRENKIPYRALAIYVVCKIPSPGYWFSAWRQLYMGFWLSEFDARSLFLRVISFRPETTLYMGLRQSMFYARSPFGLLVFTPKQNTVIYGNDYALVLRNFIWPLVLIGPWRKNERPNGQECTEASIPLRLGEEGSHRCVASMNAWMK